MTIHVNISKTCTSDVLFDSIRYRQLLKWTEVNINIKHLSFTLSNHACSEKKLTIMSVVTRTAW